jgi:hypothetical protein
MGTWNNAASEGKIRSIWSLASNNDDIFSSPFVVSTDGLFGKEAKLVLKRLALMLTENWGKPYSEACCHVNARMSIAIVRATHICVRGSRIPTSKINKSLPQWEDQAGLSLFHR